jgi:hypothetical protein
MLIIRGAHAETIEMVTALTNADNTCDVFVPTFAFHYSDVTFLCHKPAIIANRCGHLQPSPEWRFVAQPRLHWRRLRLKSRKDLHFTKTFFVDQRREGLKMPEFPTFGRLLYSLKIKYKVGR